MNEPLCTCGHSEMFHGSPQDGSVICGLCVAVCKEPPPARSRAEAEKAIAAVLGEHVIGRSDSSAKQGHWITCVCGWVSQPCGSYSFAPVAEQHRAHVASVLADLMADGQTLADAWDEGAKTLDEFHHHRRKVPGPMPPPNPYRVAGTEGDR